MRDRPALVAYEQSNGTYDGHRSDRLGRDLHEAWRISEVTPRGYARPEEESALIEQEAIEEGLQVQAIVDRLDFAGFSAVVLVSETFEVTPYRALWFGLENSCRCVAESERTGHGAIVSRCGMHGQPAADAIFCARYVAVKRTLGGLVDDGRLSLEAARRHLRTHVALLDDGRDVVFGRGSNPRGPAQSQQSPAASIVDRLLGWE